ncbi:MAG: hypothetical protein GSR80_000692 [Desulfurococcales archaeon]|nr:hypothetical protein [Desulfurococcales archaeon]
MRSLRLAALALFLALMLAPVAARAQEGYLLEAPTSEVLWVYADVTAHEISGPLARLGVYTVYARLILVFEGGSLERVYVVSASPGIITATSLWGYVESQLLSKAVSLIKGVMEEPPAVGRAWRPTSESKSIVFVVAPSTEQGQEVYKCNARGWVASLAPGGGVTGGAITAYTDARGSTPLAVKAVIEGRGFTIHVDAVTRFVRGQPPCGAPQITSKTRILLGGGAVAVTVAAIIAFMKRPRAIVVVLPRGPWA